MTLLMLFIILIFSVILHECAHGLAAERCGDPTARQAGRITLNPIPHLDPIGSILIPGIMILMSLVTGSGFIFGWAKPVPINPYNFNDPKRDMMWVGLAGPATNFAVALFLALVFRLLAISASLGAVILFYGITINLILGFFNLIPIPPLDGSRILTGLLPEEYAYKLSRIEPFGFMILIILFISGIFSFIFTLVLRLSLLLTGMPLGVLLR
ncbi:site-2 protease family protein [Candidatus Aerophobetes bacterium]|uniref:Site-2 protease family protein n=1 Tax=Aerophobetes bacterium TaxID=2030807 RepID=A0A523S1F6_UNCAE|nr:MAG: site-2 protease family protein [Candidatus Aerophobetes bacterium]